MSTMHTLQPDAVIDADNPIIVSVSAYSKALDHLRKGEKIKAIKTIRSYYSAKGIARLTLRDAKNGIERMKDELDGGIDGDTRPRIVSHLSIAAVVVNTGTSKVEVDLEELQLRILTEVNTLGLAECGRILELVDVFKAWNDGLRVGVLPGN